MKPVSAERRRVLARGLAAAIGLAGASTGARGQAQTPASAAGSEPAVRPKSSRSLRIREIAAGLDHPWSLAFLPDRSMLVTERSGRLRRIGPGGEVSPPITGLAPVRASGQGGLLDVALSPGFDRDQTVFLSFAQPSGFTGARTAVFRAELAGGALRNGQVIFRQRDDPSGGLHFGSRLVFARDGSLFVTLGDRYAHRDRAQDLGSHLGKVVRVMPDGGIPPDNPFVRTPGALPEIWSFGHRNVQGAALHPRTGQLWTHEHGPQGGDELNLTLAGRNYGWPVITFGREYGSGAPIGEGTSKAGMEQPLWQWTPSIAPSGMCFYTGDRYAGWSGSLLVGALKFQLLSRLELDGSRVLREERLLADLKERIRDVRQGPDGLVYLLTDDANGRLLQLLPG